MDLFHEFGTVHDIARYLNISPRRVQMLVKKGIIPRGKRGEYELLPCLHAYTEHLKTKISRISGLNASKARKLYFIGESGRADRPGHRGGNGVPE